MLENKMVRPSDSQSVTAVTTNCGVGDKLGTVDQAIRERKIFTALVKMPEEVQMVLLENGWIGKKSIDDGNSK